MIKSEKKLKALATVLKKDNYPMISQAIDLLRDEQPFEGAIGVLTSFYDKTDDRTIRKSIRFLCTLFSFTKDQTPDSHNCTSFFYS